MPSRRHTNPNMRVWDDVYVTIHAMPARRRSVCRLTGLLSAGGIAPTVVEGSAGETVHATYLRCASKAVDSGRPWHLHLEDDACPCPSFGPRAGTLLATTAADVLLLFSRRSAHAARPWPSDGLRRVPPSDVCYMVAVAVRLPHVAGFSAHLSAWSSVHPDAGPAHDYALRDYCRANRLRVDVAVPSLVQHADDGQSLLGHCRGKRRESGTFRSTFGEVPPC